jgi:hypothetical protein
MNETNGATMEKLKSLMIDITPEKNGGVLKRILRRGFIGWLN